MGEDSGADVASFHYDSPIGTESALLSNHPGSEARMDGDAGGSGGNVGVTNPAGDIEPVEQDAVAFRLGFQANAGRFGQIEQGLFLVKVEIVFNRLEGERTVH